MASLASIAKSIFSPAQVAYAPVRSGRPAEPRPYQLRALPNEDIYFFVKRIDNTRIVRQEDPRQRASCWKAIGGAGLAAIMLIGLLLPSVYNLLAGYQIHALQFERQRLLNDRANLVVEEARMLIPERLERMARTQHFVDPAPGAVVVLNPNADGTVAALNVPGRR